MDITRIRQMIELYRHVKALEKDLEALKNEYKASGDPDIVLDGVGKVSLVPVNADVVRLSVLPTSLAQELVRLLDVTVAAGKVPKGIRVPDEAVVEKMNFRLDIRPA